MTVFAQEDPVAFQAPWSGELLGLGAKRPTPEQLAWAEKHMVKTGAVKLNALGLRRVNLGRWMKGESWIDEADADVAPIGAEVAPAADDTFAGKSCVYAVNGVNGGHAMTIVGYSDDLWVDINANGIIESTEKGALRIANSWGTGWGEAGFCWVSYQALRTRNPSISSEGLFWFDEATWVTARASYEPQLVAEFTLNHLKRDQLVMSLGVSDTTAASGQPSKRLSAPAETKCKGSVTGWGTLPVYPAGAGILAPAARGGRDPHPVTDAIQQNRVSG